MGHDTMISSIAEEVSEGWHFVVIVIEAGKCRVYIDGVETEIEGKLQLEAILPDSLLSSADTKPENN